MKGKPDLSKLPDNDRRELRNFARFLALWPIYGFDMVQRPRWQKYLGLTATEAHQMTNRPLKLPTAGGKP